MNIIKASVQHILTPFRRSPGLRGVVYLGTAATLLQTVSGWYDGDHFTAAVLTHLTVLPLGAAVTAAGLLLEERPLTELLPTPQERRQLLLGFGIGTAAWLACAGIMRAAGWLSAPAWGWEKAPLGTVLRSAALNMIGTFAVAWNEEQVFRGYGFDTLQKSIGTPGAALVLVPLFAASHPLIPSVLVIQGVAGLNYLTQRISTGNIWFGVGYHWAWNAMQSAIFGPPDTPPSIRPLQVHGPEVWTGRAGSSEPGLMSGVVSVVSIVLLIAAWWFRKRTQQIQGQ